MVQVVSKGSMFFHSYGAATEFMAMLKPIEVLSLQLLNKFMYSSGVSRVQGKLRCTNIRYLYFVRKTRGNYGAIMYAYDRFSGATRLLK